MTAGRGRARRVADHDAAWRDPAQATSQWRASEVDPRLLRTRVRGKWWETLAASGITLLVTREYEHLALGMAVGKRGPAITYWSMPHPSGLAVDRDRGVVHVASTRNPNQIFDFEPAVGLVERLDRARGRLEGRPLLPVRSRILPGCLYIHDLALVAGTLHSNAVGENAVVRIAGEGPPERVWWPRCIERPSGPLFGQNYIQLNSIAAGRDLARSFFSASTDRLSARRPGHRNFPVNGLGVIFSGATREPIARGLTRPHSARLDEAGAVWVANSGYGQLGVVRDGRFEIVRDLAGWTRGLTIHRGIAYVGTSRVIPRFRQYAPGLDAEASTCGIHAVEMRSGHLLGSLLWPEGDQIFGIDWMPSSFASGFPFSASGKRSRRSDEHLFYAFQTRS